MPSNKSFNAALASLHAKQMPVLGVKVGDRVVEPGLYIPKADARVTPELSLSVPNRSQAKYMVICLDPDAPHPSAGFLGPVLHWLQTGLVQAADGSNRFVVSASEPFISDYAPPGPPPFSPPHRYCFLLYEQPEGFDVRKHILADGAKMGVWARMWYSLDEWERTAGLGEVVAANYFVSN